VKVFKAHLRRERGKSSCGGGGGERANNLCTEENFAAEEWRIRYRTCTYTVSVVEAATDDNKNDNENDKDGKDGGEDGDGEEEEEEGNENDDVRRLKQGATRRESKLYGHAGES